jgi:hypothetical protein
MPERVGDAAEEHCHPWHVWEWPPTPPSLEIGICRRTKMKTWLAILGTLSVALISTAHAQTELPGKLVAQIPLPVEGWMDHISVDTRGQRLFVPAEQQRAIEVVDLRAGKVIHEIT